MKRLAIPLAALSCLFAVQPGLATCGGGGGGGVGGVAPLDVPRGLPQDDLATYRVPWIVLSSGDPAPAGVLILYWFPTSPQEARASELQGSRQLTLAAGRCVAMALATTANTSLRTQFKVPGDTSLVLLVASDGTELGRVQARTGQPLGRSEVEKLLRDGLDHRDQAIDQQLDAARAKEDQGDKDGAITLYDQVWQQRCYAPRPAKKAAKALKKLGHPVEEDAKLELPDAVAPNLSPATQKSIAHALAEGLRAENGLLLADAARAYEVARQLDPADPVPLRFLGELYRHHTGEWDKAHGAFEQILAMPWADPLSRAVALHGLGKMTIHAGDFAKGLALFEESIRTYPLPLTYRNLAVYWSSEGAGDKAYGYVQQALALAPDDPYNQIFGATFLVKLGKPEEAARLARANESILAASYNLAAIWAQLGERDKALALLERHFYAYEQFEAVRKKEMEEARVDAVFSTLKDDPAFVKLTALADRAMTGGH